MHWSDSHTETNIERHRCRLRASVFYCMCNQRNIYYIYWYGTDTYQSPSIVNLFIYTFAYVQVSEGERKRRTKRFEIKIIADFAYVLCTVVTRECSLLLIHFGRTNGCFSNTSRFWEQVDHSKTMDHGTLSPLYLLRIECVIMCEQMSLPRSTASLIACRMVAMLNAGLYLESCKRQRRNKNHTKRNGQWSFD